jgi:hypothetical protein
MKFHHVIAAMYVLAATSYLVTACSGNPLASMTPADRVKLGIEALEASCGAYLSSDGPREADLDELCKAIVKPPAAASGVPYPPAAPPALSGEGGRAMAGSGEPGG